MRPPHFRSFSLPAPLLEAIGNAGYEHPTPVQVATIPAMAEGGDLIIQAQTGTGKTAAYTIPILSMLEPRPGKIEVLVLVPTRELARQVADEFNKLGAGLDITALAVYGGTSLEDQAKAVKRAQVVAATPGRLLDLHRRKAISFDNLRFFGLDEADEMLSMGFERDVFEIASLLPEERRNFLCSATIDDAISRLSTNFMAEPRHLNLSSDAIGAKSIEHIFFEVPVPDKLAVLRRIIDLYCPDGALIFANTRMATFLLQRELEADGYSVGVLNGDLSQPERERALADMRGDNLKYLVVTDVAARGIDISGLPAVVNFELPDSAEVYVHRTGRTGRAGQFGGAYSLVSPGDIAVRHALTKLFKLPIQHHAVPTEEDRLSARADAMLSEKLAHLSGDEIPYARLLPLAKRLIGRDDGHQWIARLLATAADPALIAQATPPRAQANQAAAPKAKHQAPAPTAAPEPEPAPPEPEPIHWRDADAPLQDRALALLTDKKLNPAPTRFRTSAWLAKKLDVEPGALDHALDSTDLAERRPNSRPMWRLTSPPEAQIEAPAAVEPPQPEPAPPRPPAPKPEQRPEPQATKPRQGRRQDAEERETRQPSQGAEAGTIFDQPADWAELFIQINRDDVGEPQVLVDTLAELGGLDEEDFGKVAILPEFSFVQVRRLYADDLIVAANGAEALNSTLSVSYSHKDRRSQGYSTGGR